MSKRVMAFTAAVTVLLVATGCTSTKPSSAAPADAGRGGAANPNIPQSKFFSKAEFDRQMAERRIRPEGDPSTPWLQMIQPTLVDTSKYVKHGKWHLCFSNASLDNPSRVTGMTTMMAEVKLHPEIDKFTIVDSVGNDDKQISDLAYLETKGCDALIVSPNTTRALTPAVKQFCQTHVPVIVFDHGVATDCLVSYIHPIGGYALGAASAEFIALKAGRGGKVLALRTLAGVDESETRWAAAKEIFDREDVDIVGMEFNNADPAKAKSIVSDYLKRFGTLDGVWLDAGFVSVAVAEAFKAAGQPVPPLTGDDEQGFLQLWQKDKLTAIAPTYPVYEWRTAVIAATYILSGKPVPKEWILPQPVITSDTLNDYLIPGMPPQFFSTCGCRNMTGFPQDWGGK